LNKTIVPADLKPYLRYSVFLHAAIGFAMALAFIKSAPRMSGVYTIDIVGPAPSIAENHGAAAAKPSAPAAVAKAAAGHMEEQRKIREFGARRHSQEALPPPSLLEGYQNVSAPKPAPSAAAPAEESAKPAGSPASGSVSMALSDFPYPWYISQIRMALWRQWSSRMPGGGGGSVVVFSILPDGNVTDLRTEESSGDAAFDLTALGAVKDAAPFPPLPVGFKKPFLTIHLTLTSS